jgi:multiple sugar transport system substrate-binding protein
MVSSSDINLAVALHGAEVEVYLKKALGNWQLEDLIGLEIHSWETLWTALREAIFKRNNLKVAEIGSTWLGSLVGMRAVRAFTQAEIGHMGGESAFVPAAWESLSLLDDHQVRAIPWLTDTRVLYYWRDMLTDARIDETTAFNTPANFEHTLRQLQAAGIATPLALPTTKVALLVHNLATWVWAYGGDFLSANQKATAFNQPEALAGAVAHFMLHRYLPHPAAPADENFNWQSFFKRKVAVMMTGSYFGPTFNANITPEQRTKIGMALPPGPSFVGGSHLVIMDHTPPRQEARALEIITRLIEPQVQHDLCVMTGMLPARRAVLEQPPFATDPCYRVFVEALNQGRSLPTLSLWGTIEERLIDSCTHLWAQIMANPTVDIEAIVTEEFNLLARRINPMLGG